jgi:hypothetical protein
MKSRWDSLLVGSCHVIGLTLLTLSVTAGGSAVRAGGSSPVLDSAALEPLMKLADVFSQRISKIEAKVASYTDALTTRSVTTQELCVADDTGARTCITKAQLDVLLKGVMQQTAQAGTVQAGPAKDAAPQAAPVSETPAAAPASPASADEPLQAPAVHPPGQAACPEKCIAPDAAVADVVPQETPAPAVKETVAGQETAAPKEASETAGAKEAEATTAVKETPAPIAAPPEAQPVAEQHQALATAAETEDPAGAPVKQAEPGPAAPDTTGAAPAELVADRKE